MDNNLFWIGCIYTYIYNIFILEWRASRWSSTDEGKHADERKYRNWWLCTQFKWRMYCSNNVINKTKNSLIVHEGITSIAELLFAVCQQITQVTTRLLTSYNRVVINKLMSGCVCWWLATVASCQQTCCKLIVKTYFPQACCKLFQQVVTSLQMRKVTTSLILTCWGQSCWAELSTSVHIFHTRSYTYTVGNTLDLILSNCPGVIEHMNIGRPDICHFPTYHFIIDFNVRLKF